VVGDPSPGSGRRPGRAAAGPVPVYRQF
jgi:hypothetical protein